MKRKAAQRGLLGFPLGVFLGYAITLLISLIKGVGQFYPVVPALTEVCGTQIGAVTLQFLLSGVLGAISAASSAVWENDDWSMLKQTVIHFFILCFTMLPIAYFTHWMEHSLLGMSLYFGTFVAIYALIWAVLYTSWKRKIKRVNDGIQAAKFKGA